MHTYRKQGAVWQVGFQRPSDFNPVGPEWDEEFLAAAFASFMNGGRYSPGEVEPLFPREPLSEDVTETHPQRPQSLDDYPQEQPRANG